MVDRAERKWIWWFAITAAAITIIPYLIGYARQGTDLVFTGFLFGIEDGNSYIAKMLSGSNGAWLFKTPYTSYPQNGAFLFFPYLLLGKLAAPPGLHEQMVAIFHIFRTISVILLVFATYDFLSIFLCSVRYRRFGTALIIFGGGLGWLSLFGLGSLWQNQLPLDFYSPEAFGFLMIFGLPHLACARACMLWGLRDFLNLDRSLSHWRTRVRSFAVWLIVGLMQPISIAIGWVIIAMFILLLGLRQFWLTYKRVPSDWKIWGIYLHRALWTGLLSAPLLGYTFLVFRLDPFLRLWESQNILTSPPFHHYLLSYGVVIPLAVLGIRGILQNDSMKGWFVIGWATAWSILAYLPVTIQRRMVEAAWVFLVVLALVWLEGRNRSIRRSGTVILSLSFITPLVLLSGSLSAAWMRAPTAFRPADEVEVFHALAQEAVASDIVLAPFDTSNALPAWVPVKTITGHGPESINAWKIRDEVNFFFSHSTDPEGLALIEEYQVTYVIWNNTDHSLDLEVDHPEFLELVFRRNDYFLFKVMQPEAGDG